MELIMSRAKGRVYATKAAAYDEEERDEPQVNDELVAKAGAQKAIAETYRQENERRSAELKDCLVLITHLAKKATEVDASTLTWEVYTKNACNEFLFHREKLNLCPDSEDMLASLIKHSGHTLDSPEGLKVAAIAKSQGKLRHACVRKGQFARSGDLAALARQAWVVQRWINATHVKRDGECIGIGKLCIVGWTDISDEELEGDELGDLSPDDVVPTSAHRRVHDENQVQEELY
ncbi:unnamed protein product [Closterium sp. Naga37s-1]|nr:unnamed protein product [Closterium sp. Naga37s-1]